MPSYAHAVGAVTYRFPDLRTLLARATPARTGDSLAGLAASTAEERVAAQMALAEVPLTAFLSEPVVPYETDEITRLVLDRHDAGAFAPVAHLTVGDFRDWLLAYETDAAALAQLAPGLTPEMVAAASKLMRIQDMVIAARKCRGRHTLPQHARPAPGGWRPGSSPTTRPTTRRASPPASSTACSTAAATR